MQADNVGNRLDASATDFVAGLLTGPPGQLRVLGAFRTAVYLQLPSDEVFAVLTDDAIRLPIGLVLGASSRALPLDRHGQAANLAPGSVRLGGLRVRIADRWSARLSPVGYPSPEQLELARDWSDRLAPVTGIDADDVRALTTAATAHQAAAAVGAVLGRGPGLTPSGDDVLCGMLAGAVLFGAPREPIARAVLDQLAARLRATTSLSRQLLLRAVAGDAIPETAAFAAALCGSEATDTADACARLAEVGASSGIALGLGVLSVAEQVQRAMEGSCR